MLITIKDHKFRLPRTLRCGFNMVFYVPIDFRAPLKGEHYVSGAIPEIFLAPSDLSTEYLIVKPARKAKRMAGYF